MKQEKLEEFKNFLHTKFNDELDACQLKIDELTPYSADFGDAVQKLGMKNLFICLKHFEKIHKLPVATLYDCKKHFIDRSDQLQGLKYSFSPTECNLTDAGYEKLEYNKIQEVQDRLTECINIEMPALKKDVNKVLFLIILFYFYFLIY